MISLPPSRKFAACRGLMPQHSNGLGTVSARSRSSFQEMGAKSLTPTHCNETVTYSQEHSISLGRVPSLRL